MNNLTAYAILFVAAGLEAGGDALVRLGIHRDATMPRVALLAAGAVVLFAYGITVNTPPWDFGKLLLFPLLPYLRSIYAHNCARAIEASQYLLMPQHSVATSRFKRGFARRASTHWRSTSDK